MKTKLYGILNARTKRWWYHRRLREQGRGEEARRRESAQIRDDVKRLRTTLECGGFLINSWGGWTLHYGKRQRLQSSRSGLEGPIPQACLLLGIPVLDLTTIPEDTSARCSGSQAPISSMILSLPVAIAHSTMLRSTT